jgi:hypothetical protein
VRVNSKVIERVATPPNGVVVDVGYMNFVLMVPGSKVKRPVEVELGTIVGWVISVGWIWYPPNMGPWLGMRYPPITMPTTKAIIAVPIN